MDAIGFIGLGKIGLPICKNLIDSGVSVIGYRRSNLTEFEAIGGVAAGSASEVGRRSNIVFTCMPTDAALNEVIAGPDGLLKFARPGQVIVELGSHPVAVKESYVSMLANKGAVFLDGEVSGTPGMVAGRMASIYVAGDYQAAAKIEPLIRRFSDLYLYLGEFGAATRVKLVNNLLVALNIAGTAQAMAVGLRLGISNEKLLEALTKGSGASTQLSIRAPWMADRAFKPQQGSAKALLYYLEAVRNAAVEMNVATDLIDSLVELYKRAIPAIGDQDVAAIIDHFNPKIQPGSQ